MDAKIKELANTIAELEQTLANKQTELADIRKKCQHVWPEEWQEKLGASRWGFKCVHKVCEVCGKEKTKYVK